MIVIQIEMDNEWSGNREIKVQLKYLSSSLEEQNDWWPISAADSFVIVVLVMSSFSVNGIAWHAQIEAQSECASEGYLTARVVLFAYKKSAGFTSSS